MANAKKLNRQLSFGLVGRAFFRLLPSSIYAETVLRAQKNNRHLMP